MLCTAVYLDNQLTVFINLQFCLLSPLWTSYYSKQNFNCSYIFKFSWLVYIIKRGIFFPMNGSEGKKAKTKMSNAEYRSCGFYQDFPSASTFVFFSSFSRYQLSHFLKERRRYSLSRCANVSCLSSRISKHIICFSAYLTCIRVDI